MHRRAQSDYATENQNSTEVEYLLVPQGDIIVLKYDGGGDLKNLIHTGNKVKLLNSAFD